jgi:hypothetical protein
LLNKKLQASLIDCLQEVYATLFSRENKEQCDIKLMVELLQAEKCQKTKGRPVCIATAGARKNQVAD